MKKVISIIMITILVFSLVSVNIFADVNDKMDKEKSEKTNELMSMYVELYEKYDGDSDKAIESLLKKNPSLTLADSTKAYYKSDKGKLEFIGSESKNNASDQNTSEQITTMSAMSDVVFSDSVVYDNDWDSYVYFGDWNWKLGKPDESNIQPWDCVGFSTNDPSIARAKDYILYGYNTLGMRTIYYNTDSGQSSGEVAKGTENTYGAAFWHNEASVDHGTLTVPLSYYGGNTRVMLSYGHSWTQTSITGIGGDASVDGGGLSISWDTNVYHWSDTATSYGAGIPY
jgi:hypothetical protein